MKLVDNDLMYDDKDSDKDIVDFLKANGYDIKDVGYGFHFWKHFDVPQGESHFFSADSMPFFYYRKELKMESGDLRKSNATMFIEILPTGYVPSDADRTLAVQLSVKLTPSGMDYYRRNKRALVDGMLDHIDRALNAVCPKV